MRLLKRFCSVFFLALVAGAAFAQEQGDYVAGTQPSERPANAPVVESPAKDKSWYADALHGVTQPYPYSLRFLEDQGAWFNPFTKPGMTGPYDIRGWH